MRSWRSAVTLLGAVVLLAGCASTATTPPTAPTFSSPAASSPAVSSPAPSGLPTGTHWLIAASAVSKLDDIAGPSVVARYLDGPQTTIITSRNIPASLAGWQVNFALDTRSLQ